jgi:hypothetical protein
MSKSTRQPLAQARMMIPNAAVVFPVWFVLPGIDDKQRMIQLRKLLLCCYSRACGHMQAFASRRFPVPLVDLLPKAAHDP